MDFADRSDAGRRLAKELLHLSGTDLVVLGLPRGGVPVAFEVATTLHAPLDVIVVRKIGLPFQPELAMGAIGEDGVRVVNEDVMRSAEISASEFAAVERHERTELERRAQAFRGDRTIVSLVGRTAVIVDDGVATGSTASAACQVARARGASRVVLAVPVAPRSVFSDLSGVADEIVCLETPEHFYAVGQFYDQFSQTTDDEVATLLRRAHARTEPAAVAAERNDDPPLRDVEVDVRAGRVTLDGHLTIPEDARGLVVFAHGSGSSRHSPRNRFVASSLNQAGFGTLLFDLLTPIEELDRANVFDVDLLANRLSSATEWLRAEQDAEDTPVGCFGASTGAAAALVAAAGPDTSVSAVVSRGGRPDLAGKVLPNVRVPTLLIVGDRDRVVLELNREAASLLHCENELALVPGATHLFEEPGALEEVALLARDWFGRYLSLPEG